MALSDDLERVIAARQARKRKRLRARRRRRIVVAAAVVAALVIAVTVAGGFGAASALSASCDLSTLKAVDIGENSFVYAADGSLLGSIPAERNREPVSSTHEPVAAEGDRRVEDRRFYQHGGVDYEGIARALWSDVSAGKVVEGGSTIAQQLVRNLYTGREQTFERKIKEACLAIKLSRPLVEAADPRRVPEHRLLRQPRLRGRGRGADVLLAARARISPCAQAALLAGLPQAPSIYDPFHNPKAALARRNEVLKAMLEDGGDHARAQYRWALAARRSSSSRAGSTRGSSSRTSSPT